MLEFSNFSNGFLVGLALVAAIGPQSCFVLRQGLLGRHVALVCGLCIGFDVILITSGAIGFGNFADELPQLIPSFQIAGSLFLTAYGALRIKDAWMGGHIVGFEALTAAAPSTSAVPAMLSTPFEGRSVAGVCFALTFLNPHVYLDTVVLLGSMSAHSPSPTSFSSGAILASAVFFLSLGYGARRLRPIFVRPEAWRVLDLTIGCTMLVLAMGMIAEVTS